MKNDRIIALRLPAGMYARLRKCAEDQDASVSALVRQAIRSVEPSLSNEQECVR